MDELGLALDQQSVESIETEEKQPESLDSQSLAESLGEIDKSIAELEKLYSLHIDRQA